MTAPPAGTFDRPQSHAYAEPTQPKSRSFLLIALAVVAALVIGGGAWAATRMLGGGGDQPASALPAETAAYISLDINPSVGEKIAAVRFFQGLDEDVLETLRDGDIREKAFDWMAEEDEAFAAIDYQEDIEPWLGDRMALGIVPNGGEEPYFGIALQVKNEEGADAGLTKLQEATNVGEGDDGLDWYFHGDYAVLTTTGAVGPMQDLVDAGTLADKDTFRSDMDALGDEGVLSGWVDVEPLAALADSPLAQQSMDDAASLSPSTSGLLGSLTGQSGLPQDAATGRYAAALRFAEGNIEVHGVTRGLEAAGIEGGDSGHLVLDLPEDTVAAISQEHGDQLLAKAYATFRDQMPDEMDDAEAQAAEAGFTLPDDVQTLLGSSLVLSVGPGILDLQDDMEDFDNWAIAYRTETDTAKAEDLLMRAFELTGEPEAERIALRRSDDGVFTVGVSRPYVDAVAEGGALGNHKPFQNAVPNAEDADTVFYLNVNAIEDLYLTEITDPQARESLEQLAAVGFSATLGDDGNGTFTLRFVADE